MKTAVEWLFLMINNPNRDQEFANKLLEKAKEMEKEQTKDAYLNGRYESDKVVMSDNFYAEQYYNETFKQQEQNGNNEILR